ncbi:MAG: type I restriction enzyme HsdR N-terminal domain-containing protein [Bacteroidales bacterium]|nr:type I restriction enzyme HsdR N-terminal domain-containing protein [Bacteroidales bacterium]
MDQLNFPQANLRISYDTTTPQVFDIVRRRKVALTPEEWVRQNLIHFLINHRRYSPSLMAVETTIKVYKTSRRADVVCFLAPDVPWLICECKAPSVKLSQSVLDQALKYNIVYKAQHLLITNGLQHVCYTLSPNKETATICNDIPYSPHTSHSQLIK